MPKYPASEQMGRRGIIHIASTCEKLRMIWRETPDSDVGFDGEIELVDGDNATGKIIKVQCKGGRSHIRNERCGTFDYYADADHIEYWRSATNPVILVVYDPEEKNVYWVDVKSYTTSHPESVSGMAHKITFHRIRDVFSETSGDALRALFGEGYKEAESDYRQQVIERFGKLTLYSIKSDAPVAVELEKVFVKLSAVRHATSEKARKDEDLRKGFFQTDEGVDLLFAKIQQLGTGHQLGDAVTVSIPEVLRECARVSILGAPGAGKTTLLKYVALTFARHQGSARLGIHEPLLPIYIPLRDFNRYLENLKIRGLLNDLTPNLLTSFLTEQVCNTPSFRTVPEDFFTHVLSHGRTIVLLDGVDEIADPLQRARTAELVANVVEHVRFRDNRFVITSRPRGYEGEVRQRLSPLCAEFSIREFDDSDRQAFAEAWCLAVITDREGNSNTSRQNARVAAQDLLRAVAADARITALATNPLLLSILALVHQRGKGLPHRRADLYEECTEMLLGYWDQTKGGEAARELSRQGDLDRGEKLALLEPVALWMHERGEMGFEVTAEELELQIAGRFQSLGEPIQSSRRRARIFIRAITDRAGLLVECEPGMYSFIHLTFQEYLAARTVADRRDYVAYSINHIQDPWWREVLLLEASHLSGPNTRRSRELTTHLIGAMLAEGYELFACRALADIGQMGIEDTCRADCLDSIFGLWQLSYSTETARSIQELFTYMGPTPDGAKLCSKLISVLTVSDPELRWRAMQALFAFSEAIPGDDLIDQIVALIGHTSDEIRGLAVQVIQIWGDRVSAPMTKRLIGLSRDSCEDVRWRAAAALGAIRGSESTPMAVQRLNELAGDESETVRKSASAALVRLMVVRR